MTKGGLDHTYITLLVVICPVETCLFLKKGGGANPISADYSL